MSTTDEHDERLVKLVANVTGIECGAALAIGKSTTISGAALHASATRILRAKGKSMEDATAAEYAAALEQAGAEIGYDPAGDLITV